MRLSFTLVFLGLLLIVFSFLEIRNLPLGESIRSGSLLSGIIGGVCVAVLSIVHFSKHIQGNNYEFKGGKNYALLMRIVGVGILILIVAGRFFLSQEFVQVRIALSILLTEGILIVLVWLCFYEVKNGPVYFTRSRT